MSFYELISVLFAAIAAVISLVVWNGQRKLQRESNDLQRATAELARKQLEILVKEETQKQAARLKLDLLQYGKDYKFVITNIGSGDAYEVNIQLILESNKGSPLIKSDVDSKLPAKKLSPGSNISLIAALHMGSPSAYNALLTWKDANGTLFQDETYASL